MYDITGTNIQLPDNVTLAGGTPGAGIDIIDSANTTKALLYLGNNNTIVDLTVTHSRSPQTNVESNPVRDKDFHNKLSIVSDEKDNIKIINSSFEGNVSIFVDFRGGDNLLVQNSTFEGSYTQLRTSGDTTNATITNSLFKNSLGDGIKTLHSNGVTEGALVSDSVFMNHFRDGIDLTGGFRDSIIENSYFINNGVSGIDIKTIYDSDDDLRTGGSRPVNDNILIKGSEFIDNNHAIVTTTLDRGIPEKYLTVNNAHNLATQNIKLENSIVEANVGSSNMFHIKDSHSINWQNVTLLGSVTETKFRDNYNVGLNSSVSGSNVTTGSSRGTQPDSYYEEMAGTDWSNLSYPTGGTPTPPSTDPVPSPDPISYIPPADTPVVDDPAHIPEVVVDTTPSADSGSGSFAGKLLNIYLAYSDTDKNIALLDDGTNIDSNLTADRPLTIYASSQEGAPNVGSVQLKVPGVGSRLENAEPYALFGDNSKGNLWGGRKWADGTYTVTLTAFEGKNGSGKVLETMIFDFTLGGPTSTQIVTSPVTNDPTPDPVVVTLQPETDLQRDAEPLPSSNPLFNISLIDTKTDNTIIDLHEGIKLSNSDLSGRNLTISAAALDPDTAGIGSMRLDLDGLYSRVENVAPYALFGDNAKGDFSGGTTLGSGTHFATLTAYSGKNGKGSVLEKVTVQFDVGNYDTVMVGGTASAVSSYSSKQDTGTASVSGNQMSITLDGSAWKSLDHFKTITDMTVMKVDFKSSTEGEIQGIGFSNGKGDLGSTFFQLDGSQDLGIQAFNDLYETSSGSDTYFIPVGQYFTGEFDQLVLVNDDDAGLGASSTFENISFFEAVA